MGGRGSKLCPDGFLCCTKDAKKDVQHFPENQTSQTEKLAITAQQGETFKDDLVHSENKTRKKHMQDDTDSDDKEKGESTQINVIDHVGAMYFGPVGKSVTNNYNLQKERKRKPPAPPEYSISKSGDGSTDAGEHFRIADGGKIAGLEIDMLQAKQSVGIIRGPGNLQGTGFLLMHNLVMTAFHVIKDIVLRDENGKVLNLQHTKDLSIQFGYQEAKDAQNKETYFNFTPDIQYHNQQLDVVVLKLSPDSKNLPKPFELFSPVQQGMKAHIIGHPQGGILEVDPKIERFELSNEMYRKAVEWSLENHGENGYQGIQDKNKVLFHCRFAHGASGSPGCYTDQTKKQAEVVWMLLEGYPGFHYKNQTYGRQMNVPDEFLIEQGITMEAIWKDMSKEKSDLAQKIFGHRSERFLPILDTCSNAS